MSTLSCNETIQRVGQYTCIIQADNPEDMRIGITKLDPAAYKEHRDVCRADFAAFEDAAYELQEELLAKIGG